MSGGRYVESGCAAIPPRGTSNRAMCEFYGHPGWRGSTEELGRRALDYVLKCETRLLIIDDLHFLHWQNKGGIEISNNFKYIVNDFPITLVSIGIGLIERGCSWTPLTTNCWHRPAAEPPF